VKLLLALAVISVGLLGAAGCSAAKITCAVSTGAWFKHGGAADAAAVRRALIGDGRAANAVVQAKFGPASLAALKTAAAKLGAAVTTMRGNLPPGCVPGVRADMRAGLDDFAKSVTAQDQAVAAARRHDLAAAAAPFRATAADLRAGATKFIGAAHAVTRYVRH
jgi:hypothetical protein